MEQQEPRGWKVSGETALSGARGGKGPNSSRGLGQGRLHGTAGSSAHRTDGACSAVNVAEGGGRMMWRF